MFRIFFLIVLLITDVYNWKQSLEIIICTTVLSYILVHLRIYYIYTVDHDVIISKPTNKRKRCDEEERISGATQSDMFIVESEDESQYPKRSKQGMLIPWL